MSAVIVSLIVAFLGGGLASGIFDYFRKKGVDKAIEEKTRLESEKLKLEIERARHESNVELKKLDEQQKNQQSEIEDLKFLFATVLTDYERSHLKKLNSPDQFTYRWHDDFKAELSRLLALHFIERCSKKGIRTAKADTRSDNDLREHFSITEKGKQYLGRLETLEQASRDVEP
jgi:hypothetical protein